MPKPSRSAEIFSPSPFGKKYFALIFLSLLLLFPSFSLSHETESIKVVVVGDTGIGERAFQVMAEAGVDISKHTSKHVDDVMYVNFDYVITVCSNADETCPVFPGKTWVVHVGFDDPPKLAEGAATEEEALSHYRRVRDEIKEFVSKLPDNLEPDPAA